MMPSGLCRDERGYDTVVARSAHSAPMRVLLVADGRSPTTRGWIEAIHSAGVVVLGLDGKPWPDLRSPSRNRQRGVASAMYRLRLQAISSPTRLRVVQWWRRALGPFIAWNRGRRLRATFDRVNPDVVHALRIPYEAMAAAAACPRNVPLAVSIWGNDLTLHASSSRVTGRFTRKVLARADVLFADCQRDIDLARDWGLRPNAQTALLPGGGGVCVDRIVAGAGLSERHLSELLNSDCRLIVNPRGSREYVRNDVLLEALAMLDADLDPRVRLVFVDAVHDRALRRSIEERALSKRAIVTGKVPRDEVLALFVRTEIYASITAHDGTPNSLLEAMAAGAVPVCGDLPSIREWVTHGLNGFLGTSDDHRSVAEALRLALDLSPADRTALAAHNASIIRTRAERGWTGRRAAAEYSTVKARQGATASGERAAPLRAPPPAA